MPVDDLASRASAGANLGAQRAAAVLVGLGADAASALVRYFDESDLRQIATGARALRRRPETALTEALHSFISAMEGLGAEAALGDELLREVAAAAVGPEVARRAFEGLAPPPPPDEALGPLATADPEALAMVLAREQPQTVALVLSALDPDRAAQTIEHLSESLRPAVIRRMASVEAVAPEVLREVGQALAGELQSVVAGGLRRVDGKAVALQVLRRSSTERQQQMLAAIEQDDPALAAELRSELFTFEDLRNLQDRDLQLLLKEVDSSQLTVALKGASVELKEKLMRNLSTRAAAMLADDLAAMAPVKVSAVEAAQAAVVRTALGLAEQGRLTLINPTDKLI